MRNWLVRARWLLIAVAIGISRPDDSSWAITGHKHRAAGIGLETSDLNVGQVGGRQPRRWGMSNSLSAGALVRFQEPPAWSATGGLSSLGALSFWRRQR